MNFKYTIGDGYKMGKRIKKTEVYENRFYRIPKAFFKTEKYKELSLYAKVIYGFLDDRRELSLKNNWVDAEDNIYLIFTRKEIQEMLCLSNVPVTNAFKQLNEYGLIEEVIQGLNKPNLIYVCHIDFENIENMRIHTINDSRVVDNMNQESLKVGSIDTDINKTNLKETEIYTSLISDDNVFLKIYKDYFYNKFNKEHMRMSNSSFNELATWINNLVECGLDTDYWEEQVQEHFSNLPYSNNGNILAFMESSFRHFEVNSPKQDAEGY